jgi:prepilin-type N-terminal cleavage/methylation domain-containing protein
MKIFKSKGLSLKSLFCNNFTSKKKTRGFTLVELLVVFSIITFLSSVVLAGVSNSREKANDSKITQDMRQFRIAVELYYSDHQSYNIISINNEESKKLAENTNSSKTNSWASLLNTFPIKKAEAAGAGDTKCTNFNAIALILLNHKYLTAIPVHPKDNTTTGVCYKIYIDPVSFSYISAYGALSTKTSIGTVKKIGFVTGDLSLVKLQALYNATLEFPTGSGGGAPTTETDIVDDIIDVTKGSTAGVYGIMVNSYVGGTMSNSGGTYTKSPNKGSYVYGDSVSLTATPNPGYTFSYWSGCDSTNSNICNLTMNSTKTVYLYFTQTPQYSLTVIKNPYEGGQYTSTPSLAYYSYGTSVTLTAIPNSGYTVNGWNGCNTFRGSTCTVIMDSSKTVTLNFSGGAI